MDKAFCVAYQLHLLPAESWSLFVLKIRVVYPSVLVTQSTCIVSKFGALPVYVFEEPCVFVNKMVLQPATTSMFAQAESFQLPQPPVLGKEGAETVTPFTLSESDVVGLLRPSAYLKLILDVPAASDMKDQVTVSLGYQYTILLFAI